MKLLNQQLQIDDINLPVVSSEINIDPEILAATHDEIEHLLQSNISVYSTLSTTLFAAQLILPNEFNDFAHYQASAVESYRTVVLPFYNPEQEAKLDFILMSVALHQLFPESNVFQLGTEWEAEFADQLLSRPKNGIMPSWLALRMAFPHNTANRLVSDDRVGIALRSILGDIRYETGFNNPNYWHLLFGWVYYLQSNDSPLIVSLSGELLNILDQRLPIELAAGNLGAYWFFQLIRLLLQGYRIIPGSNRPLELVKSVELISAKTDLPVNIIYS